MMKNYKGILYGAVAYSVVIGVVYVTLSLLALLARWDVIDANSSPFIYMLYLLYFRASGHQFDWNNLGIVSGVEVRMEETDILQRTIILFFIYLALHAALIFFSFDALCGVNNSCLGRKSFAIFFLPWIFVWVAVIILDITATVFFSIDAVNSQDTDVLTRDMLGIQNWQIVAPILDTNLSFLQLNFPSIMMALVAGKLFFFFLANIIWVIAIRKAGWAAATYHKYVDDSRRNYENNLGNQNPAFDDFEPKNQSRSYTSSDHRSSIHEIPVSPTRDSSDRYRDTSTRVQAFVYTQNRQQSTQINEGQAVVEEEITYRIQRPNVQDRPASVTVQQIEKTTYRNDSIDPEIENRLSRFQESNGLVIRTVEPLKYEDIPEQHKSIIGVRVLPPAPISRSQSDAKPKPIPPPKPNNRFSMAPMAENDEPILYRPQDYRPSGGAKLERHSSSIKPVPAELRNQFAFNYLDPNNQVPKRSFQNLSEDEEPPSVPVPDYTLHFPQNSRKRTNLSNSDEDYSSQYSQQNQQRY